METFVTCPECRKDLLLPEKMLHKYVRCPECGGAFRAEERPAVALPAPRPAESEEDGRPRPGRRRPANKKGPPDARRMPWYLWALTAFPCAVALVSGSCGLWTLALILSLTGLLITLQRWSVATRLTVLLVVNAAVYGMVLLRFLADREERRALAAFEAERPAVFPRKRERAVPGGPREPPPATDFAGLVGYWSFDEIGAGGEVPDRSGRGNHGQLRGPKAEPVAGVRGKAVHFRDGAWFDYGASPDFDFPAGGGFTIALWVRTPKRFGTLVSQRRRDDAGAVLDVFLSEGLVFAGVRPDGEAAAHTVGVGESIGDGWHHVAVLRRQGNHVALYKDGELAADLAGARAGGALTTDGRAVAAGRRWLPAFFPDNPNGRAGLTHLEGAVDELCIFNRALGDDEIRQLAGR